MRAAPVLLLLLPLTACIEQSADPPEARPTAPAALPTPGTPTRAVPSLGRATTMPTSPGPGPGGQGPAPEATTSTEPGTPDGRVPQTGPRLRPRDVDAGIAGRAVRQLAGRIGSRHATSRAYRQAASWVADQFRRSGYAVRRRWFEVPAGVSWGVPVPGGRSANLVATPPGFDLRAPHLVIGAHLDTVPGSPGAEDNASGVGVMLAVAAALGDRRARLPVVFVAFGAEEPRGPGDANHHYGSRHYVRALRPAQRAAVRGMLSLDRVGVGTVVPVGSATGEPPTPLVRAGRRAGVPVLPETRQRSSDHWSFVRAGLPGLRVGSTPYAGYHGPGDVVPGVNPAQLDRVARLVAAWLSA